MGKYVEIPIVKINRLLKALTLIAGYIQKVPPGNREQAVAMLHIVRRIAEDAIEEDREWM